MLSREEPNIDSLHKTRTLNKTIYHEKHTIEHKKTRTTGSNFERVRSIQLLKWSVHTTDRTRMEATVFRLAKEVMSKNSKGNDTAVRATASSTR